MADEVSRPEPAHGVGGVGAWEMPTSVSSTLRAIGGVSERPPLTEENRLAGEKACGVHCGGGADCNLQKEHH